MPTILSKLQRVKISYQRVLVCKRDAREPDSPKKEPVEEKIQSPQHDPFKSKCVSSLPMELGSAQWSIPDHTDDDSNNKSLAALVEVMKVVRRSLSLERCDQKNEILEALKTWLHVFFVYGFRFQECLPEVLAKKIVKTYRCAAAVAVQEGWIKYFKYRSASFFSAWNSQPLPERPRSLTGEMCKNDKYLFGGPFFKFLNRLKRSKEIRAFALAINQSKKGMPRPSDDDVRKAELESFNTMTTPKEQDTFVFRWDRLELPLTQREVQESYVNVPSEWKERSTRPWSNIELGREFMEAEIRRTTQDIFKDWRPELEVLTQIFLPSASSNYNRTRSKFGTYGELNDLEITAEFARNTQGCLKFRHKMTMLSNYVSEYFGARGVADEAEARASEIAREALMLCVDVSDFLVHWRKFFWKCVALAQEEPPLVEVVGLKEALKVRCISKGPPITYFVLKPIQKSMWSHLQRFWNFELTGTPVTEELFRERFDKHVGKRMHSGDFKGATDNLHSWASDLANEVVFDCAEGNLGYSLGPFRALCKRALTGHIYAWYEMKTEMVTNPKTGKTREEKRKQLVCTKPQARGQLMGSIVSFVFLCILNMTLTRAAYEKSHGVRVSIRDLPCYINGDDVVVAYTEETYPIWWKGLGSILGFEESVGKTHDSKKFCSINSTYYQVKNGSWCHIPYVNMGLMKGMKRSACKDEQDHIMNLGVCHRELIDSIPRSAVGEKIRNRAHTLFFYLNNRRLKEFKGSWFLPVSLGGLGLRNMVPYTEQERTYASMARILVDEGELQSPTFKTDKEWVHFDTYQRRVRRESPLLSKYSYENYEGDETHGVAFVTLCYDQWFAEGLSDLYNPVHTPETTTLKESLRFQATVQWYVQNWGSYIKPLPEEEITEEVKRKVVPVAIDDYGIPFFEPNSD